MSGILGSTNYQLLHNLFELNTTGNSASQTNSYSKKQKVTEGSSSDDPLSDVATMVLSRLPSQNIVACRALDKTLKNKLNICENTPVPAHLQARLAVKDNEPLKAFLKDKRALGNLVNIYSPSNQKKIVFSLLEEIQKDTILSNTAEILLKDYLKGCDSLDLSNRRIDNAKLNILSEHLSSSLQSLDLSGTQITDISPLVH